MGVFSVPVTIGVDEEAIAKNIEKNVEKMVVDRISREVLSVMCDSAWDYRSQSYHINEKDKGPLEKMVKDNIEKVVEKYKDNIIELAAEKFAEKFTKTKSAKELMVAHIVSK